MPGGDAAEHAGDEEDLVGGGEAGEQRGRDRQRHAQQQHHLAPVAVAERAEVEDRGGEPERVADGDQVERRLAGVEGLADVRQGDVGDREVEVGDRGDQDQRREDEPGALGAARLHRGVTTYPSVDTVTRGRPVAERIAAMSERKRPEAPRGEESCRGVWRLRLPLPWPGVPHGNAWAVEADGGIVLFDTGMGGKGRLRQLDLALARPGSGSRTSACSSAPTPTSTTTASPRSIVEAAGCELWMHPAWEHVRLLADDPAAALEHAARGGPPERRPGRGAGALPRVARRRRRDRDRRDPGARPRPRSPGSRSRPTSAPGRSTRPPATRPPTSSCTSPSAS